MSARSPTPSPRTSLNKSQDSVSQPSLSPVSSGSGDTVDKTDTDRNDLNNNDHDGGPVRKIAGKKISALFEVCILFMLGCLSLVEG